MYASSYTWCSSSTRRKGILYLSWCGTSTRRKEILYPYLV
jgi:hypothetical protein